jgi:hypothetical protein
MSTDRAAAALATLARLRRLEIDVARRDLATRIDAEEAARAVANAASQAILAETEAAIGAADDASVEAFARWLTRVGRPSLAAAEAALAVAEADTTRARAALGVARADGKAIDRAVERRADHAAAGRARAEAHEADDAARNAAAGRRGANK